MTPSVIALRSRLEAFFVPLQLQPSGTIDRSAVQLRASRMVASIAVASVILFVPTLLVAGVSLDQWPAYIAAVIAAALALTLLVVRAPARPRSSAVGALAAVLIVVLLHRVIGAHYHQLSLLVALVIAGVAVVHGVQPALVAAVAGGLAAPTLSMAPPPAYLADAAFAILYLLALVGTIWTYIKLEERASAALAASEHQYRDLVERVPAVVYTGGPGAGGARRYVSPRIEGLLGYPAARWMEEPGFWRSRIHPDDLDTILSHEQGRAPGAITSLSYRLLHRDGTVRWVADQSAVELGDGSAGWCRRGFLVDVTERMELEARLRQAERLQAVGQLAGGIAHDFNNVLAAIRGFAELALDDAAEAERADIVEIIAASDRGAALARQLLAFSRRQVLRAEVLELEAVVDGLVPMLRRLVGEHITLETTHAGGCRVRADRSQVEQVLLNLVVNGRDAMADGGRLLLATAPADGSAVITVRDTGCGMTPEVVAHAFEPFFTTKDRSRGTGMGLATVIGIVEQSGGRVACESAPGVGSTFRVYLPLVCSEAGAEPPEPARPAAAGVSPGRP